MTTVAVLTSIYGAYDALTDPPEQTVSCSWVAVTDQPSESQVWRVIVEPRSHMHPRLAAKVAKCLPHWYTSADVTIWIDGSARITSPHFVQMCLDSLNGEGWAQWIHPDRSCIFDEADVSTHMQKYAGQPVREQVEHYRQMGHKPHAGLWATGCIVRRCGSFDHGGFGKVWLAEQMRWSYQDQLSEPWLIVKNELPAPAPLPASLWANPWVRFGDHAGGDG